MHAPPTAPPPAASPQPVLRIAIQAALFLVGLGLLYWCYRIAFGPENREQLEKLRQATPGQIGALVGLSIGSLLVNGGTFAASLRPLPHTDVLSTNAIACFLNYLPFKIGLLTRLAIHTRRDRIPIFIIGAWFAAVAVLLLTTLGCLMLATVIMPPGLVWGVIALGALVCSGAIIVFSARYFAGDEGLVHIRAIGDSIARGLHLPLISKIAASKPIAQLHSAGDVLARPDVVAANMVLRFLDITFMTARVVVAGTILGKTIAPGEAFIVASTGFLIGIVSPGGQVGPREGAIVIAARYFKLAQPDAFAVVALLIAATEAIAFGAAAIAGALWLWLTKASRGSTATPG
jgi:hypothetical protein